ncbi:uncharacterized protein [Taeniopygia guttata]|uniref:uncharacterized protein n=1 Tax=Taeniopygia guttata TaxID=59729 RepID=UPI003BB976CA
MTALRTWCRQNQSPTRIPQQPSGQSARQRGPAAPRPERAALPPLPLSRPRPRPRPAAAALAARGEVPTGRPRQQRWARLGPRAPVRGSVPALLPAARSPRSCPRLGPRAPARGSVPALLPAARSPRSCPPRLPALGPRPFRRRTKARQLAGGCRRQTPRVKPAPKELRNARKSTGTAEVHSDLCSKHPMPHSSAPSGLAIGKELTRRTSAKRRGNEAASDAQGHTPPAGRWLAKLL